MVGRGLQARPERAAEIAAEFVHLKVDIVRGDCVSSSALTTCCIISAETSAACVNGPMCPAPSTTFSWLSDSSDTSALARAKRPSCGINRPLTMTAHFARIGPFLKFGNALTPPQAQGESMNEAIAIVITGALIVAAAIVIAGGAISTQISSM
jgi:hypothetical protein